MNTVYFDKEGNVRKPQTWEEVKNSVCRWDSCEPCSYNGGHSRTGGGFECTHPLHEAPYKVESQEIVDVGSDKRILIKRQELPNPVIQCSRKSPSRSGGKGNE